MAVRPATYLFAFCAALNSCNIGFDVGVNTDAAMMLQNSMDLSDVRLQLFMGSLNFFAMIGALLAHIISDRFGRRGAFIIASAGFMVGIIVMATAQSYLVLMLGRFVVGLGVGFGLAVDPIYISEISPPAVRGQLVTWSEIALNIGIVLGFCSGAIFWKVSEDIAWRGMFAMGAIMPLCIIFLSIFVMPESPRWLIAKGRYDEAKLTLSKIYPEGDDIDAVVHDIKEGIERETTETQTNQAAGWDMILHPTPTVHRMLLVGIGISVFQQMVGIDAIQYFLVYIIYESGITDRAAEVGVLVSLGLLKLGCIFLAGYLFDRSGRRPLLFLSLGGMIFSLLLLASTFIFDGMRSFVAVLSLALYLAFFSLGMGPGAWLIPSEVFSTPIRAKAMSLATFLNRLAGTIMASTFLTAANLLTRGGFFLLLVAICIMAVFFVHYYLPETKDKSLEEMTEYFAEITKYETMSSTAEAELVQTYERFGAVNDAVPPPSSRNNNNNNNNATFISTF